MRNINPSDDADSKSGVIIFAVKNINNRVEYLDGHRGLAILLVMFFHAFARWPDLLPYGSEFSEIPVFKFGWLGVELFFLISGYVILMTLEKCATGKEFLYRRWLRLFPAMLICSVAIFSSAAFFHERPSGPPSWISLLPGLTFIEPDWWTFLLGLEVQGIEGVFWSLYVEFKFYVFAAVIYYWKGRDALIWSLLGAFLLTTILRLVGKYLGFNDLSVVEAFFTSLSFRYFGWFASGAAFYVFSQNKSLKWFAWAVFAVMTSAIVEGGFDAQRLLATSGVSIFFAASTVLDGVKNFLSNRLFIFFGAISYPLYLIHENAMVSMVIKMNRIVNDIPDSMLPIIAIMLLSIAAYLIAHYIEPAVKSVLIKIANITGNPTKVTKTNA